LTGRIAKPGVAAAVARFSRSIRVQLTVLTVIFLSIPILLYSVFRDADLDKQRLLLDTVRESGMLVARALTPLLEALPQGELGRVPRELARFQSEQHSLTLFYKPKAASSAAGFFYVASAPPVPAERLESERARLLELGILQRLAASCTGNVPLSERIASPGATAEIVTSVTPVQSGNGCWAVVIATEARAAASIVDGRPYWARPEVRLALAIYGAMALLVVVVVVAVWRSLTRFRRTAAAVEAGERFELSAGVPELLPMAREFDRMVERLRRAAERLRHAAEDNAHALKGPIAVIRQSLELARPCASLDGDAALGLSAIAASLVRLDGLVQSARRLDTAAAELLNVIQTPIDLSQLVECFATDCRTSLGPRASALVVEVEAGLGIEGDSELVETILENLVDNALSFTSETGQVFLQARAAGEEAVLSVEDEGPGVDHANLDRIFDRYYSSRPKDCGSHFGIGLWLVRQNAIELGGSVRAVNRATGGLSVTVRLPLRRS
jgi:two-component system sensor histidine kinase ChvG